MNQENIATIGDVIDFLEKNYKLDDKIGFFFEGGAWCELVNVSMANLGRHIFLYVRDKVTVELDSTDSCENNLNDSNSLENMILNNYRMVNPKDVVVC